MNTSSHGSHARAGKGMGWFIAAVVLLALVASIILAPNAWSKLRDLARGPGDEGPEPTIPTNAGGELKNTKEGNTSLEAMTNPGVRTSKEIPVTDQPTSKPVTIKEPVPETRVENTAARPDDAMAKKLISEAEGYYKAFNWTMTQSTADKVTRMQANPSLLMRAKELSHGAVVLKTLFEQLDIKDELVRNYETDPALVLIGSPSQRTEAVPLISRDPIIPYAGADVLDYIASTRRDGSVLFMIKGTKEFIMSPMSSEMIGEPEKVDSEAIRQERKAELQQLVAKVEASQEYASDAARWYELARFGYRNRIDDRVVEFLDRGLLIQPNLAYYIRNQKAQILAQAMIAQLKGKTPQIAANYMAIINKKYSDTDAGKMAAAVYNKKDEDAKKLARQIEDQRRKEDQERIADLKRRAEEQQRAGREEAANKLRDAAQQKEKEKKEENPDEPKDSGEKTGTGTAQPGNADVAKADALMERARSLFAEAMELPSGRQRNVKLHEAEPIARDAVKTISQLISQGLVPESKGTDIRAILMAIRRAQTM